MKDFIKLLFALWIVKYLVVDNDLLEKITQKFKDFVKKVIEK